MRNLFTAHFRIVDHERQTVEQHNENVAKMCGEFASHIFFEKLGFLAGLLHDMGKLSDGFQDYINRSIENQLAGLEPLKKEIDHGKDGAIFVFERYVLCFLYAPSLLVEHGFSLRSPR